MKRAYTSLHPGTKHEQDLLTAVKWAQGQAQDGQQVTVWSAHRDCLQQGLQSGLRKMGIEVVAERPRRRGAPAPRNFRGPLLAVGFTTLTGVLNVEPFEHPMCLVGAFDPRNGILDDHPHVRWIEAFDPECLAGPPIEVPEPLIADPVVACAMDSFTSITYNGTTMYDSRDGGRVTDGLMLLHHGGHRFDPERLFFAALRDGWEGSQALMFKQVARDVARGVRKRPGERLGPGVLQHWRSAGG
ncbi:hypothetical protein M3697_10800 [Janibacter melonis]|uniref:hypothetical protein n=1 Tax=Janibacter melonis TaxID=262209 RepID=UPI002043557C|nr:hypothetical protein [Janibacter melonis]MCM3555591.1 hypothetical protein [Janibacter melonis]